MAKTAWAVGSEASVMGPFPAHSEQKQLGVTFLRHVGLLSGSDPVSAHFDQNLWASWFSQRTRATMLLGPMGLPSAAGEAKAAF